MSLKDVEADIKKTIQSRVKKIKDSAKKEADSIIAEAKERIKKQKTELESDENISSDAIKKREIASANLHARKIKLQVKKEILNSLYAQVKQNIYKLKGAERTKILESLIDRGKTEISAKYIYSNEADSATVRGLAKGLTFNGTIDCGGGVVLENADSSISVDYTFDTMLETIKRETLQDVSKKLFGDYGQ